jgi:hypothetical protein
MGSRVNAFGASTATRTRSNTRALPRPATAMGNHGADGELEGERGPNGTNIPDLSSKPSKTGLRSKKVWPAASVQCLSNTQNSASRRHSSLISMMGDLSLLDSRPYGTTHGSQAVSKLELYSVKKEDSPQVPLINITVKPQRKEEESQLQQRLLNAPSLDPLRPETPRRKTDQMAQQVELLGSAITAARSAASPMKSASPIKLDFLTKDSNTKAFTGWDMDERLGGIESHFKELKDAVSLSLNDRKTLEDAVDMSKRRGRS